MSDEPTKRFTLSRWSRRKLEAARATEPSPARPSSSPASSSPSTAAATRESAVVAPSIAHRAAGVAQGAAMAVTPAGTVTETTISASPARSNDASAALPPVDTLTFEADFTPFLGPGVDETVRRAALKKLLRDPRFNVMDGLDVYIDDYTVASPLAPEVARTLAQARYVLDPPRTRVTADGFVEDIPDEVATTDDDAPETNEAATRPDEAASVEGPRRTGSERIGGIVESANHADAAGRDDGASGGPDAHRDFQVADVAPAVPGTAATVRVGADTAVASAVDAASTAAVPAVAGISTPDREAAMHAPVVPPITAPWKPSA